MKGELCSEVEVNVAASEAWEIFGTLKLAELIEEKLPLIEKIEVVEGDGGVGTILNITFVPGTPGLSSYKEKYTRIDDERRLKEAEVVEGGYLDFGFALYRVRLEIVETGPEMCVIKSTIEYEVKEGVDANVCNMVSLKPLEDIASLVATHLKAL